MTFWNTWTFDPFTLAGLLVLFALYTRGLWRSRGRSGNLFPWWRPTAFYTGLIALLLGAVSPIDGLSDDLFLMHMVQHVLLMMVGPPLILVGAPVVPVLRGLPRILRDDLAIPLLQMRRVRKILNFLASPLTAWMVFVFTLWIWHVPALYNEAVVNEPLHFLEHMMFMGAAVLFWWTVIDPIPLKPRLSYALRLLFPLHGDTAEHGAVGDHHAHGNGDVHVLRERAEVVGAIGAGGPDDRGARHVDTGRGHLLHGADDYLLRDAGARQRTDASARRPPSQRPEGGGDGCETLRDFSPTH